MEIYKIKCKLTSKIKDKYTYTYIQQNNAKMTSITQKQIMCKLKPYIEQGVIVSNCVFSTPKPQNSY